MDILFVNIYPKTTIARYLLSSYGLKAFLDARLTPAQAFTTRVLNFGANTEVSRILSACRQPPPDLICFSCYTWNIDLVTQVLRQLQQDPSPPVVLGGPEITLEAVPVDTAEKGQTYYVIGEGEYTLFRLLEWLDDSAADLADLPVGVVSFSEGRSVYHEMAPEISDLDTLPSIYLTETIEDRFVAYQQAFLETQRGCTYRCKYCVYPCTSPTIRYYSLDRVRSELRHLIVDKRVRAIRFNDANFLSDLDRAHAIVRMLLELKTEGHQLPWVYWEYNLSHADPTFLALCAELKVHNVIANRDTCDAKNRAQHYSEMLEGYTAIQCVGIQSLHQPACRAVARPYMNLEKSSAFLEQVNALNLVCKIDLILGLPFETTESFFAGIAALLPWCAETDHVLNIHLLEILPGSRLEKDSGRYGIVYERQAPHVVIQTNTMSPEEIRTNCRWTAILCRLFNSPLRFLFYQTYVHAGLPLVDFLQALYEGLLQKQADSSAVELFSARVTDEYWNGKVFAEISSEDVRSVLLEHGPLARC